MKRAFVDLSGWVGRLRQAGVFHLLRAYPRVLAVAAALVGCEGGSPLGPVERPPECYATPGDEWALVGEPCDFRGLLARTATGTCSLGRFACLADGKLACLGAVPPERLDWCVGADTNCDGKLEPDSLGEFELCYQGPRQTLLNRDAPCRPGFWRCGTAGLECYGQVLPEPEVLGNCIDDDCDGVVDSAPLPVNLFVVLDRSSSMDLYRQIISGLMREVQAMQREGTDIRVWVMDVPHTWTSPDPGFNSVCHPDLTPPLLPCTATAFNQFAYIDEPALNGVEPIYDAVYDIVTRMDSTQAVLAVPGNNVIVIFGDERPDQSQNGVTLERLTGKVATSSFTVHAFTLPGLHNEDGVDFVIDDLYTPFATVHNLVAERAVLHADFRALIQRACR